MNAPIPIMIETIEAYIYAHTGAKVICKPDLTSQRELFLLEYVYSYIMQHQGFTVHYG